MPDHQMFAVLIRGACECRGIGAWDDAMSAIVQFRMACACTRHCFFGEPPDHIRMFANDAFQPGGKTHAHLVFRQAWKDHWVMDFCNPGYSEFTLQPVTGQMRTIRAASCVQNFWLAIADDMRADQIRGDGPR